MAEVYNIGNQIKISFKDGSSIVAQVTAQNDSELTCKALSKNEVYNEGDTVFVDTVTDKIEKISLKKESSSIADEALGYGFEGDESEPDCPHCNGVKMYQNGEIDDYGNYLWSCPECGYSEDDEDVQERYSMKKKALDDSIQNKVESYVNGNPNAYNSKNILMDFAITYQDEIKGMDEFNEVFELVDRYIEMNPNANRYKQSLKDFALTVLAIDDEDDYLDDEVTGLKKQSKRFQYKFDKHKSPWTWNKESELIEKDEEAINKAAMKKKAENYYDITKYDQIRDFYSYDRLGYVGFNAVASQLKIDGYSDEDILLYLGSTFIRHFYDEIQYDIEKFIEEKIASHEIEREMEVLNKEKFKQGKKGKLNYQVLLYSETDFEDTLIQEAKKFNGKYIGHGVGFGDYDIQFEFRNEDDMNRFINQMKNANFITGIDIQVYDGDNFIENRTVKGIKKQSNIDNKLSGLFDSPDDTFTVRIYSNQRDYENGESEREMQNFDNEDEAYEWIHSFDYPYYYEITVIPKEGQGYVWETGECEPY